jgi:hypothetical protein
MSSDGGIKHSHFHSVEPLHALVIDLLGSAVTKMYKSSD